ncbi:MAG: GNAT family N-acetyltransferase [Candidatus Altiarchaeota archaeon]|nr:GNAT family N-acetyltransferase [Candidatus Altiarchaeota archaeon]
MAKAKKRRPQIRVRKVQPKDLPRIRRLLKTYSEHFDPPFSPNAIRTEVDQIGRFKTAVVAESRGGRLLGFSRYGHTAHRTPILRDLKRIPKSQQRHGYIFLILTSRLARGKGVGTKLTQESIKRIGKTKYPDGTPVREVVMTCHDANLGTRGIARKLGFELWGKISAKGKRMEYGNTLVFGKVLK